MTLSEENNVSALSPIDKMQGSLGQRVYQSLRDAIVCLDLRPGEVLRKGEICDHLGVSRSPASEAIGRLAAEGLVDVVPQSGTRVSYLSLPEIREGAFIREALELAAIEKVARDRTEDEMMRLTRNLRLQALLIEDHDFTGFYQADEEFHALILQITGFPRLAQLSNTVSSQVSRARRLLLPTPGRAAETLAEHTLVAEAIRAKDPRGAREVMHAHLGQLIKRIEPLEHERPELFGGV